MPLQTSFVKNQSINRFFKKVDSQVFTFSAIKDIFEQYRDRWNLPMYMGPRKFIDELLKETKMKCIKIKFPIIHLARYVWGMKPNLYTLAATIQNKNYFSHFSAMYLNKLTDQIPKNIYINVEQKQRPPNEQKLTQEGINKAFKNRPRITANVAKIEEYTINLLNGKQTANLGVVKKEIDGIGTVSLTNIERTLIDIAVRPVYSGGVSEVLKAYKASRGLVSIATIIKYLTKIDHKYPYHQNIGFYLEKAGFPEDEVSMLYKIKREFTFYLDNRIEKPVLSQKWNLYYPSGI